MQFRRIGPGDVAEVARLFALVADDPYFQPHPMTAKHASVVCQSDTRDLYLGGFQDDRLFAYGMLRGWANHPHPSLGITVSPIARGLGIGRQMMGHLHQTARDAGASRVRLRVHPQNGVAHALYGSLGYVFSGELDRGQLVGWLDL